MNRSYINSLAQNIVVETIQRTIGLESCESIYSDSSIREDLGCDELDMMELIMNIEWGLNITIDDSFFINETCTTINPELTVQDIIDLCADKIATALDSNEDYESSLPTKPEQNLLPFVEHTESADEKNVMDIIKECSKAKYISADATLEDTGIDPVAVVDKALSCAMLDLGQIDYEVQESEEDSLNLILDSEVFVSGVPFNDIETIADMVNELQEGFQASVNLECNLYDIVLSVADDKLFCEENSYYSAYIDERRFLQTLKDAYGIEIDKQVVADFQGTIKELCSELMKLIGNPPMD